jgi:hypothetical protein
VWLGGSGLLSCFLGGVWTGGLYSSTHLDAQWPHVLLSTVGLNLCDFSSFKFRPSSSRPFWMPEMSIAGTDLWTNSTIESVSCWVRAQFRLASTSLCCFCSEGWLLGRWNGHAKHHGQSHVFERASILVLFSLTAPFRFAHDPCQDCLQSVQIISHSFPSEELPQGHDLSLTGVFFLPDCFWLTLLTSKSLSLTWLKLDSPRLSVSVGVSARGFEHQDVRTNGENMQLLKVTCPQ